MIERILFFILLMIVAGKMLLGSYDVAATVPNTEEKPQATNTAALGPIVIIKIDGTINPAVDDYVKTSMQRAKYEDARLLIIQLNTPGGLLSSMESISKEVLSSTIPVVVYVGPAGARAVSAGMYITIAAHFAVMAPGTTIGAAHPVSSGSDNVQGDMRDKLENYASSLARSLAEQRGRNVDWVEKAVLDSVAVTDREALEKGVVNFIASDLEKVITELDGRSVSLQGKTVTFEHLSDVSRLYLDMNLRQRVVNVLADPNIAILFGLAAIMGIMAELYHPGMSVPGVVGVICLILSLTASQVIPINYGGVALLVLGIIFIVVELFVPSFGVWGIGGTICLILGAIYSIDTDMIWSADAYGVRKGFVMFFALFVGSVLYLLAAYLKKHRIGLQLNGSEALIGASGQVTKWSFDKLRNIWIGKVRVNGELWNAKLAKSAKLHVHNNDRTSANITVGSKIIVSKLGKGMILEVVPDDEDFPVKPKA